VSWSLGTLASGQVSNLTVTVTARQWLVDERRQCEHADGDPNLTNNITPPW